MQSRLDLKPWLASVFVPSEHRERGVGEALVQRVVDEAREIGYETLYLFTTDKEAFYAKRGWKRLERTEYRDEKVTIMSMDLSAGNGGE